MSAAPFAVISDVHGNRWALEAVLEDMRRRGVRCAANLGDCVYGPLDPAGTARMLMSLELPTVRGNEDRLVIEAALPGADPKAIAARNRAALEPGQVAWLEGLALTAVLDDLWFLCHGTPDSDDSYLLESVGASGRIARRSGVAIDRSLAGVSERLVLCGHSHVPGSARTPGGRLVVNPGSVGVQAFEDSSPRPHVVEAGSPHARYAVLKRSGEAWSVEQVRVVYDWEAAARRASDNGREDWAYWLASGRVR